MPRSSLAADHGRNIHSWGEAQAFSAHLELWNRRRSSSNGLPMSGNSHSRASARAASSRSSSQSPEPRSPPAPMTTNLNGRATRRISRGTPAETDNVDVARLTLYPSRSAPTKVRQPYNRLYFERNQYQFCEVGLARSAAMCMSDSRSPYPRSAPCRRSKPSLQPAFAETACSSMHAPIRTPQSDAH